MAEGCVICAIRPFSVFGYIIGTIPIKFQCCHSHPNKLLCTLKIHWTSIIRNILLDVFFIVCMYFNVLDIKESCNKNEGFTILIYKLLYLFQILVGLVANVFGLIQLSKEWMHLEALQSIMVQISWYRMNCLFSQSSQEVLKRSTYKYIVFIICYFLCPSILFLFYDVVVLEREVSKKSLFNIFSASLSLMCFATRLCGANILVAVYKHIFVELFDELKRKLNNVRKSTVNLDAVTGEDTLEMLEIYRDIVQNVLPTSEEFVPLAEEIGRIQQLYLCLIINITYINHTIDPIVVLTFVGVIVYVGITSYTLMVTAIDHMDPQFTIYCFVSLLFVLIFILHSVSCLEQLYEPISDLESFVYNFPISGLGQDESTAVAMLMMALHDRPPILTASHLFNLRADIVFSIFGTVLTYVIMALQFKMASD